MGNCTWIMEVKLYQDSRIYCLESEQRAHDAFSESTTTTKKNPKRGSRHLLNHLYLHFSPLSYRLLIHQKAMWVEFVGANQPQQSQSLVGGRNLYSMWYINVQGVVFSQITFPFSRALQQSVDSITFRWNLICLILSEMSELTSLTCLFWQGSGQMPFCVHSWLIWL